MEVFKAGLIKGYQTPTRTIIVEEEESPLEELFEVVEKLCIKLYGYFSFKLALLTGKQT